MPHFSIVSPVFNAEKTIQILVNRIEKSIIKITNDYEIILVEDSSTDNSWEEIERLANIKQKVIGLKLSRNFGQHYAITAGLDQSNGDWVVVMDCDLQDQPEEIEKLYQEAQKGFSVVLASRFDRQDNILKKFSSKLFYIILSYLTGIDQDHGVANFGIYSRKVVETIVTMRESIRYFPSMVKWVGFNSTKVNVVHGPRVEGESNYNFKRRVKLALDIMLAYSDKPIRILIKTGLFISSLAVLVALIYFIKWWNGDTVVLGYTSLIISIWLLSGIILSTLGIIGLYVGKIFEGVKNRPIYIIEKMVR